MNNNKLIIINLVWDKALTGSVVESNVNYEDLRFAYEAVAASTVGEVTASCTYRTTTDDGPHTAIFATQN